MPPVIPETLPKLPQIQLVPFHSKVWPALQVLSKLRLTFPLLPPPASPVPADIWVIVPTPGNVCPGANVSCPLLAMENPVGFGTTPFEPNRRLRIPEGLDESFPTASACHRKSWEIAVEVVLLNDDASKSSGLEAKPCVAVAVPLAGSTAPTAVTAPVKVAVDDFNPFGKVAVVPVNAPFKVPPASCKYRPSVKVVSRLRVPLVVIGPPAKPDPAATLVTVPPELGAALVSVTVPPSATVPPPDNPDPAATVIEGLASMVLAIPPAGILIVPVLVIGPPAKPGPVAMLVTVPGPVPGKA